MGNIVQPVVMAVDPGLNGAYAVLNKDQGVIAAGELPRFAKVLNAIALADLVRAHKPDLVVIERVSARPGQGVVSMFHFGTAFGQCIGAVSALRIQIGFVTPGSWKRHFSLIKKEKDAAREYAVRAYPAFADQLKLKKHHGRADAILMARYALDGGKLT